MAAIHNSWESTSAPTKWYPGGDWIIDFISLPTLSTCQPNNSGHYSSVSLIYLRITAPPHGVRIFKDNKFSCVTTCISNHSNFYSKGRQHWFFVHLHRRYWLSSMFFRLLSWWWFLLAQPSGLSLHTYHHCGNLNHWPKTHNNRGFNINPSLIDWLMIISF